MNHPYRLREVVDRFTTVSLVGLDLGSSVLKVAEVEPLKEGIHLRRTAIRKVAKGESLTQSINALLSEAGIRSHHAVVGVASPEVIARSFHFPSMPGKELASAVRLEAEQAILNGHTLDEMAIDWHLLSDSAKGALRGLLAVVPKSVIASRSKAVKEAGLNPIVVDVEGLALWNAYWTLIGSHESASKTILLINLGVSKTNLVIAKGRDELILTRDLEIGTKGLAEGRKKDWTEEIVDSLAYARSKGGIRSLDSVYVTGGGSRDPEVLTLLKPAVTAPVILWNPLEQVTWDSENLKIENSAGPLLTIAIGLALRRLS